MKLFLIAFAVIAAVSADVSHLPSNEYLPPQAVAAPAPSNEYLAPQLVAAPIQVAAPAPVEIVEEPVPAHELADDGYRYKTHRRVVYRRHRRDVSHLPSNEYLPPQAVAAPIQVAAPVLSNEYLPPQQVAAPIQVAAPAPVEIVEEPVPAHELADDGYRYKTHRRVVYRRHRRDVSHLPSNEYLPPQAVAAPAPSNEYLPPQQVAAPIQVAAPAPVEIVEEPVPAHELADDGYRYKTHRRVVLRRHRRDVNELANEYLPPVQEELSNEYLAPEPTPAHVFGDDGYRYKTQRRVVLRRHRRDVSHLPTNEYLPPQAVAAPIQVAAPAPSNEYLPPQQVAAPIQVAAPAPVEIVEEPVPAHELADDGYRYKTHRRVVYRRHRRDVSHLPTNEYLPPQAVAAPIQVAAPAPSNEYLPPQQVAAPIQVAAPAPVEIVEEPVPAHELAADGYRYKTHRRVVYRRH